MDEQTTDGVVSDRIFELYKLQCTHVDAIEIADDRWRCARYKNLNSPAAISTSIETTIKMQT